MEPAFYYIFLFLAGFTLGVELVLSIDLYAIVSKSRKK